MRWAITLAGPLFFVAALALWTMLDSGPKIDGTDRDTWRQTSAEATRGLSDAEVERFRQAIEVLTHHCAYNDPSYGQDIYDNRTRMVTHGKTVRQVITEAETYRGKPEPRWPR